MIIIALILFLGLTVQEELSASTKADNSSFSGYAEAGRKSTAEDYEEEDTDDDYIYKNYHLKLENKVSECLSYDIGSFIYDKDYKSSDSLDNISRIFKMNLKSKKEPLAADFKLKYKEKRYDSSPRNEYNEIMAAPSVTFKNEDLYKVDIDFGIDDFDYLDADEKDQIKAFGKVGLDRYFLEKKLMLISSYRIEATEQEKANRNRIKHEVGGGFDYRAELPLIYKIITRLNWGERDTKDEEYRDDDFDYEYWRYYIKTEHKISLKLKTNLKYQYLKRDYAANADLDHGGFYIRQEYNYEILDDTKQRLDFDFDIEHKDIDYTQKSGNNYKKDTVEIKAAYQKKKNWKLSTSFEDNFYDFNDSSNDKKRTYVLLSGEKLFFEGDLILSLDLKYRYTDYDKKDDQEQEAVRLGFRYRF